MNRLIHITPFDRIIVNILQFLPHHFLIQHLFRMCPFLPKLILTIFFMFHFVKLQLF
ncbi:hypothetical protein THIOM_002301 [Candidatus Thiomargarita nelsonii]|uniref:Uncharacterized protein n=1 Tax=Candidatus Thiomargarita nelsonii TaxID=1003181 RepID=A0A176S1N0_9GAMM|nr:hypothetical protein THIOM_002301 [Candidatus Thiomargarita nelsonii]